jgi:phosphatidate phosphatase APP1
MSNPAKKRFQWLFNWLHINYEPVVKVYHGYGDQDLVLVYGHVFKRSPLPKSTYRRNFLSNTLSLVRLFMAKPYPGIKLQLQWEGELIEAETDTDGFFKLEWKPGKALVSGWHLINVTIASGVHKGVSGEGKVMVPFPTQYAFVSDIDDTFLVSHSSKMGKRLYVLFTKNARTRKPFEGVVRHYRLLATSNAEAGVTNPFFYVSSSEWNLYEYIKEFCRNYELPEGVYLLSQLKQWHELLLSGQTKHNGKFMRIARLLKEFPHQHFILLGDDTQQDPFIYASLVDAFPGRILAVYLRHIRKSRKPSVEPLLERMKQANVEVCYFKHSDEAIMHSQRIGLIKELIVTDGK